jgi:rhamnosyltransferase
MNMSSKTVAITVTYNPDLNILRQQLEALRPQCESIIIDNNSEKTIFEILQSSCNGITHRIIPLERNMGISTAQNTGIKYVLENFPKVEFILLLDHDSVPSPGMIEILEKEFAALVEAGRNPAALGPLLYDPRDKKFIGFHVLRPGFLYKKILPADNSLPIKCEGLNSSGSLISLNAIKKIGLLTEDFFIDHGETEWCYRAMDNGFTLYGIPGVVMTHCMGDDVCRYWLFGWRRMPYRSPLRHYYIVRNSIHLQKRSYVPRIWKFWNVFKIMFTFAYFGLFSREPREQRKYILKGLRDGFRGITGQLAQEGKI